MANDFVQKMEDATNRIIVLQQEIIDLEIAQKNLEQEARDVSRTRYEKKKEIGSLRAIIASVQVNKAIVENYNKAEAEKLEASKILEDAKKKAEEIIKEAEAKQTA